MRIATAGVRTGFAMTHYKKCGASPDGRTGASGPTDDKEICASPVRADVGIDPYNRISAPRKKTAEGRSFSCTYLL